MTRSARLRKQITRLADLSADPAAAPRVAPALESAVDAYIAQCRREDARDGRVPVLDAAWEYLTHRPRVAIAGAIAFYVGVICLIALGGH